MVPALALPGSWLPFWIFAAFFKRKDAGGADALSNTCHGALP